MQLTFSAGLAQLGERQTEDLEVLSSILRDRINIFFSLRPTLCYQRDTQVVASQQVLAIIVTYEMRSGTLTFWSTSTR